MDNTTKKAPTPVREHEGSHPTDPADMIGKAAREAKRERTLVNKVKAVGKELARDIGGEYERREDKTAP